jgi:hypothetical protein
MKGAERISRSLGVFAGKCAVGNYHQTLAVITAITKYFKPTGNATTGGFTHGIVSVDIVNPSELGYLANWDYTTGCFKCFYVDKSTQSTLTMAASATVSALGTVYISTASGVIGHTGTATTINISAVVAAAAPQLGSDVNAGTFGFVAIGFI